MAKKSKSQKKRRDKKYTGRDAATIGTKVTRVTAPERSKFGEWWVENKRRLLVYGVLGVVLFLLYLLFTWLFSLVF